jgi:hypothetical protein
MELPSALKNPQRVFTSRDTHRDDSLRGGLVQIVEDGPNGDTVLVPRHILVNGTNVGLIAENGITIDPGSHDRPATVTLVLLPRRIEVFAPAADPPAAASGEAPGVAEPDGTVPTRAPQLGDLVHYRAHGSPPDPQDGVQTYRAECRAALITATYPQTTETVGLVALNPTGLFFHQHASYFDRGHQGGSWHWPGFCPP